MSMHVPISVAKESQIDAIVNDVARELSGDVVRIRFSIETDWSGDWSVSFRVVLTDSATRGKRLRLVASRVRAALSERPFAARSV